MPHHVVQIVEDTLKEVGKTIVSSTIGVLGVAYKGNVADARETPSKEFITELNDLGAKVHAHDPYVDRDIIKKMGAKPVKLEAALKCDCVVLMTDHDVYHEITPKMIKNSIMICNRKILNKKEFMDKGIVFKGVGRGK